MTGNDTALDVKRQRILRYLTDMGYEGLVIGGPRNFAWFTGGGSNAVDRTAACGVAVIKVTGRYMKLITSRIEARRMAEEVVQDLPVEIVAVPWHDRDALAAEIRRDKRHLRLTGDVSIAGAGIAQMTRPFWTLQVPLLEDEIERYRALGRDASAAVEEVARAMQCGWTERDVAAELSRVLARGGMWPAVLLVGGDERLERYRHPVPTEKSIERVCMIVLCAERGGLIANLTRMVAFGGVADELRETHQRVAEIDAAFVGASVPGAALRDVLDVGREAYARAGWPDEWQHHHQGGTTGYNTREVIATPHSGETLCAGQAVAWNPSAPGVKSEDTFLVTDTEPECLTPVHDWPVVEVSAGGRTLLRPAILER